MNYFAASVEVSTACNLCCQHNWNLFLAAIRIYENLYNQEHLFTGMKGIKGITPYNQRLYAFVFNLKAFVFDVIPFIPFIPVKLLLTLIDFHRGQLSL